MLSRREGQNMAEVDAVSTTRPPMEVRPTERERIIARHNIRVSGAEAGQPLMLVHGFGCDQSMWEPVARQFEDTFRVVLLDLVGAGGSDLSAYTSQKYGTLKGYARDILEICQALDLERVVFVGHSVSAMIGVLASIESPERFDKLVLVGPSPRYIDDTDYTGGFSEEAIHELLESLDANYLGWSTSMAPVIAGNPDHPECGPRLTESFCRTDPAIAKEFARTTFLSDNRADLARVSVPTLILQCSNDPIAPEVVGGFVHQEIAGSTIVHLDATGHCPNLSAPDETSEAIRAFIEPT